MSKPEERTFKIEHKDKNYLVQMRSDKGLWITDAESQDIINVFNASDFTIETLQKRNLALQDANDFIQTSYDALKKETTTLKRQYLIFRVVAYMGVLAYIIKHIL